ncbi:MAG: hypothetical protein V1726_06605 [Methanobacteriota archaeon]
MRKLFIFAAVILLLVLFLGACFFLGSLGDLAIRLGHHSQSLVESERDRFLGTWENLNDQMFYTFLSNGTFSRWESDGGLWGVEDNTMSLWSDTGELIGRYQYQFSDDDARFVLIDENDAQIVFLKR